MKILSIKKKIVAICVLAITFILSLLCAFSFNGLKTAKAATIDEIKAEYQTFLSTYTGNNPEMDFIKYAENNADMKYFSQIGFDYKEKLTDEGVATIYEIFGITESDVLRNGGSIGSANQEKWSGKYVSTSANNVPVGGDSIEDGDFSIVVMGDQQTAVEYYSAMVASSYDYIVSNKDAMNLKMFINVGDIVDDTKFISWRELGGNTVTNNGVTDYRYYINMHPGRLGNWKMQQKFALTQAQKLLDAGIPSAFTMGNHDYGDMAESYRIKDNFIADFSIEKFGTVANGYKGSLYNDIEAACYEFEANNQKYMVVVIGCYPTTEILNWANQVVENNPDHKVIVSTHAYMDGSTEDLRPDGQVIWDEFVKKHENIFMLVNGHDCTDDGSILRRVDFGENGNAVTQLMINPQVEEFGGAGTFAQLIFRTDGTVDLVYYSPYANANNDGKGYFMNENQFTFSLNPEKVSVTEEQQDKEVLVDKDLFTNAVKQTYVYLGHDTEDPEDKVNVVDGVYAYNNAMFTESGFTSKTEGSSYVIHKLYAGEYKRFNRLSVKALGTFNAIDGAYQIDVSLDGENYITALYNNAETGEFNREFNVDRFIAGAEYLYVKVLARNATINKLMLDGTSVKTVFTDKSFLLNYSFANNVDPGLYEDWDMEGGYSNYYACLSGNILGSGGPGRMSYKSNVTYRFDSGDSSRYFKEFNVDFIFRAQYLLSQAEGVYNFSQKEGLDSILTISISIDDGKTYIPIKNYSEEDCGVSASKPTNDFWVNLAVLDDTIIDELLDGERVNSFILKIDYFGAGPQRAHAGLYNLNLSGELNKEIKVSNKVEYTRTFELNGGYFEKKTDSIPKKSGHEFKGWYLTSDFSGKKINPDDYKNGNYTFYAKWARGYYITYVLDGGVNSEYNVSIINEDSFLNLVAPTKQGKTFVGWYDEQGTKYTKVQGSELSKDLVLYAVWTDKSTSSEGCSSNINSDLTVVLLTSIVCLACVFGKKLFANKNR